MANSEHVKRLQAIIDRTKKRSMLHPAEEWNAWRRRNPGVRPNLSGTNFSRANLREADFSRTNFRGTDLSEANLSETQLQNVELQDANLSKALLSEADLRWTHLVGVNFTGVDLSGANLREANLSEAILYRANLHEANLREANLREANLREALLALADLSDANLSGADLSSANLSLANLVRAQLFGTTLTGARMYGASVWDVETDSEIKQTELVITPFGQSDITVDDLEVAQFVYLLLNNKKIRNIINTVGQKGVLILGRFTAERKAVLDAIREKLRALGYVPMMFDFDKPTDKDFTETVMTLAGMSKFIIADITNPKSSPLELQAAVPNYRVPFVPIIQEGEKPFSMFKDLHGKYDWVLKPLEYDTAENLIEKLEKGVINRALERHKELVRRKAMELQTVKLKDL